MGSQKPGHRNEVAGLREIDGELAPSTDDEAAGEGGGRGSLAWLVALVLALGAWVVLAEFVWGGAP